MHTAYKNYDIQFNEDTGKFSVSELGLETELWSEATAAIRAAIRDEKKSEKVNKVAVLKLERYGRDKLAEGFAGKKDDNTRWGEYYWFTTGKERSKEAARDLILDTQENRDILEKYLSLLEESKRLDLRAQEVLDTAETMAKTDED
jgi:hypothetical protein